MARFSRLQVLDEILRIGVVPVFYHSDLETAKQIVHACTTGGARIVEFTNRGDNAYRIFSDLVLHFEKADPSIILGIGSVLDPATAALYISSGANFVVGSVLNPEVARVCNRRKIAYCPGCGSASEISQAEELGVEIVKVFPGDSVGGPGFVRSVLGPTPWTRIMPTGGVEATKASLEAWFKAGVAAVGIGSHLIRKDWVDAGNYSAITAKMVEVIGWIREVRGENVFRGIEHPGLYPLHGGSAKQIADWYGMTFGFKVTEGRSSFFLAGPGPGRIEVMKQGDTDRCHLAIEVSDFDAAVAELQARGLECEEPKVGQDLKAAYLKQTDPAGNRIHLLWRRR
jgi:2-dehydro-3-deoxyphosphogluconate aldolase/(4S)-4-hydroxy-2-oxoglutarate aldolase